MVRLYGRTIFVFPLTGHDLVKEIFFSCAAMKCQGKIGLQKNEFSLDRQTLQCSNTGAHERGVRALYTDYGYSVDGIEYATVDEAEEATREAQEADNDTSD